MNTATRLVITGRTDHRLRRGKKISPITSNLQTDDGMPLSEVHGLNRPSLRLTRASSTCAHRRSAPINTKRRIASRLDRFRKPRTLHSHTSVLRPVACSDDHGTPRTQRYA
ncbi:hypothetical protein LshimejAT787_0601630 [Lyophyllum shimeji]|uniref:Uncharacterized protein n=1 Tax=Lyophyllum shimeji TaxID=47721 RepID=A0A9P3PPG8_LYOSH|nr:hypothetical protein LshimejAT787_0601630 [Lyophyllum shimeji]